ncbi:MAG: hypothetical protein MUE94_10490 [Verrucomicrobia bacterium]|jgi:hypothetical protein|nr:hypothetical protein [Verrucomicrobiota bacterium]
MGSYEEVLVDVVRYKYLCDEGFVTPPTPQARLRCQEDGYFQHLVQCIATDTGMAPAIAERGLVHAALQRGRLDSKFFEAVVTQLYA